VLASAGFTAACALFAVTFVAARGGLQMPIAPSLPPVAMASDGPTVAPPTGPPVTDPVFTPAPTPAPTPEPIATAVPPSPSAAPTAEPNPGRTFSLPTLRPNDPLAALPACRGYPGCYEYVIESGDSLTGIADKFLVGTNTMFALNPRLRESSRIVTGQVLYLARSPFVRLERCPDFQPCSLYEVLPGDSLGEIATWFGLTTERILNANPGMERPLVVGQVITLPHPR
jgi:hypothetical protein